MEQLITSDFKLGILGGGQLGKMLTLAASNWDIKTYVLDPNLNCPASHTCTQFIHNDFTSYNSVYEFGKNLDMITIEIEGVNIEALEQLKKEGVKVYPEPNKLAIIKDKGLQKEFYKNNNIPTSKFHLYENEQEIISAYKLDKISLPFVQKLRTDGYDGNGVLVAKKQDDLKNLLKGKSLIEEQVKIKKEIAVIIARSTKGEVKCFPPVEMEFNSTANLVEFLSCPAKLTKEIVEKANQLAVEVVEKLNFEGLLAVEMFLTDDDLLMINEIAPRPHNSGHHTIESIFTSQYEQHLRAIFGFPLGSTEVKIPSIMINVLGEPNYEGNVIYEGITKCMALDGVKFHIYGKKTTKPYRKMGHITILDRDLEKAKEKAKFIKDNLKVIA